ncbi:MAG TPA: hypothetical protein [Caudoviricetes sp.]|nr:MAG TPA: hypothetical protein [Caudoviricetes sp.]
MFAYTAENVLMALGLQCLSLLLVSLKTAYFHLKTH